MMVTGRVQVFARAQVVDIFNGWSSLVVEELDNEVGLYVIHRLQGSATEVLAGAVDYMKTRGWEVVAGSEWVNVNGHGDRYNIPVVGEFEFAG